MKLTEMFYGSYSTKIPLSGSQAVIKVWSKKKGVILNHSGKRRVEMDENRKRRFEEFCRNSNQMTNSLKLKINQLWKNNDT